ncbi:MAG: hypothetical protein Kow0077_15440 [Anaerolineae bacterium]
MTRKTLIILLIALANALVFGAHLVLLGTGASDGTRLNPGGAIWQPDGMAVSTIEGVPTPLQTGDVILAVAGHPVSDWVQALGCLRQHCGAITRPAWQPGETLVYTIRRGDTALDLAVPLQPYPFISLLARNWGGLLFAVTNALLFLLLFIRRPEEAGLQAMLIGASGLLGSMGWLFGLHTGDLLTGVGFWVHRVATDGIYLLAWIGLAHFALVFPRPHTLIRRYPWLIPALYPLAFALYGTYALITRLMMPGTLLWLGGLANGQSGVIALYLLIAAAAVMTNYRATTDAVSRQQVRIVAFALAAVTTIAIVFWALPGALQGQPILSSNTMGVIGLIGPLAIAVSIQRYRLWDIEVLISRTLIYSALTVIVIGLYTLVVGTLSLVFRSGDNIVVSLLATGVVAVSFQTIRDQLQRSITRLMFGERDEPYSVLEQFTEQLEPAQDAPALPAMIETVAHALKLPYAAIALHKGTESQIAAEYPAGGHTAHAGQIERLPLAYRQQTLGALLVARRGPNEPFSRTERQLLSTIARLASLAVYNMHLAEDLQHARERLVSAREEERRRLRRDLHDGLGPVLAAMTLQLDAILNHLTDEQVQVRALVTGLKTQVQGALTSIRQIAYNLRPPALDELGLCAALQQHFASIQHPTDFTILFTPPKELPALPAAVEVAIYRIALEAVTNARRHAEATRCIVVLRCEEALTLEVTDNGRGIDPNARAGVGLAAMRERAAELGGTCQIVRAEGGGTRVFVQLPVATATPAGED